MIHLPIPIVGLRHRMKQPEAFVAALKEGQPVVLLCEDANPVDPMAIGAWISEQQVGYVSADYVELLRLSFPDRTLLEAQVCTSPFLPLSHTGFYADVCVPELFFPLSERRIALDPLCGLPLPHFRTPWLLRMHDIYGRLDAVLGDINADSVSPDTFRLLTELILLFSEGFGHSLNGDELRLYLRLTQCAQLLLMCFYPHDHTLALELTDAMEALAEKRRHYASTDDGRLELFLQEKELVREQAAPFLEQLDALLRSGYATRKAELQAQRQWLRNLPGRVYSRVDNPALFATQLHYLRLSAEELHAVMLHLVSLEHLEGSTGTGATREQRIAQFPFWMPESLLCNRREAVRRMEKTLHREKNAVAALALELKRLQRDCVIRRDVKPHSKLCRALNALLGTDIKPDSLKRYFHDD